MRVAVVFDREFDCFASFSLLLKTGARGVGIGSMVNKLTVQSQMVLAVAAVANALGRVACAPEGQVEMANVVAAAKMSTRQSVQRL